MINVAQPTIVLPRRRMNYRSPPFDQIPVSGSCVPHQPRKQECAARIAETEERNLDGRSPATLLKIDCLANVCYKKNLTASRTMQAARCERASADDFFTRFPDRRFWTGSARTPLLASVNAGRHIVRYRIRTFMNDHGFRLRKRVKASES